MGLIFVLLVLATAVQRLLELVVSASNEAHLRARGGYEAGAGHFWIMRLLHFSWFLALLYRAGEVRVGWWTLVGLAMFGCGQYLRYVAITTLGRRWCVKVIVLPGEPVVASGVYSKVRHPNYVGVALELAGLPLAAGLWGVAVFFTVANAMLMELRISVEEAALEKESNESTKSD